MSASNAEVQEFSDQILELLGNRLVCGQLVIHYSDGKVQGTQVTNIYRERQNRALRKNRLDNGP